MSNISNHTPEQSNNQYTLENSNKSNESPLIQTNSASFERDPLLTSKSSYDPIAELKEDRARRKQLMNDLRTSHARQRASLAARFNVLPQIDPMGGMVAPDYYDDGMINQSAPYIKSRYKRNYW